MAEEGFRGDGRVSLEFGVDSLELGVGSVEYRTNGYDVRFFY